MASTRQSVVVTVLGVVNLILGGLLGVCSAASMILLGVIGSDLEKSNPGVSFIEAVGGIGLEWATVTLVAAMVACLFMASGYGLVKRSKWGRYLALFVATIVGLFMLATIVSPNASMDVVSTLAFAGYCLFCCVVLFQRRNFFEFR